MPKRPTRLDYCPYLLVSPLNHTLIHFADHAEDISHDAINRFLRDEKMTPHLVWDNVRDLMAAPPTGCVVFDDTIIDKSFSHKIELVRRQYSGNAHGIVKGIGVVTCVYVNPETEEHWVIDYRIYDLQGDGLSKLDHVREMLSNVVHHKGLACRTVLMDTWYATRELMLFIESLGKIYYCPLKNNRLVDDSGGAFAYRHVDSLDWNERETTHGKIIKIKGFPKEHKVKLFRVAVSTPRTDAVVTNDLTQDVTRAHNKRVPCAGRLSSFIERRNNSPESSAANAEKRESNAITLPAPCLCGFAGLPSPAAQGKPCIASSRDCLTISCGSS